MPNETESGLLEKVFHFNPGEAVYIYPRDSIIRAEDMTQQDYVDTTQEDYTKREYCFVRTERGPVMSSVLGIDEMYSFFKAIYESEAVPKFEAPKANENSH